MSVALVFCWLATSLKASSAVPQFQLITITTTVCNTQNPETTGTLLPLSLFYLAQDLRQRWHPVTVREHLLPAGLSGVPRTMHMAVLGFQTFL